MVESLRARVLSGSLAAVMIAATFVGIQAAGPPPAQALSGSDFDPGLIISDEEFFDRGAMTAAQIQTFLNARVGSCANANCLAVYRQSTATRPATARCQQYSGASNESAASIIFKVQQACGVSAKALLVTLQKEQGLITNRAPSDATLRIAMGYGCPDTSACDSLYFGFFNQMYSAANQFQRYAQFPSSFRHRAGATIDIYYHPNSFIPSPPTCGTQRVTIRNQATAGLYNYTPYVPNASALANLYGTGDRCASYGNRNFWRFYNEWFGSPTGGAPTEGPPFAVESNAGVLGTDAAGRSWMYPTDGRGNFGLRFPLAEQAEVTKRTGVGDLTGDGRRDLLAARDGTELVLLPGASSGVFGAPQSVATFDSPIETILSTGAADPFGLVDALVITEAGNLFHLDYSGRGVFASPRLVGQGWDVMRWVTVPGDITGDGRPDIVAVAMDGRLLVYPGSGVATWSRPSVVGSGWASMGAVFAGSAFSGDNTPNLLAVDSAGRLLQYRSNQASGWFGARVVGTGWGGMSQLAMTGPPAGDPFVDNPGVGDVTGDGENDVLALRASGDVVVYPGNGRGGWAGGPRVVGSWDPASEFSGAGDFDGNGVRDIVRVDEAGRLIIHFFSPSGELDEGRQIGNGWSAIANAAVVGDVSGDGKIDVVAIDDGGRAWVYPGRGDGVFLPRYQIAEGWSDRTALIAAGDFQGRGAASFITRTASGVLYAHGMNAEGMLLPQQRVGQGWAAFDRIFSPGDFDGDGRADILARRSDGALILYPGSGSSGFGQARQVGNGWQSMSWLM